jgi:LAS superfamily LD-carboxypeptidase LdcB
MIAMKTHEIHWKKWVAVMVIAIIVVGLFSYGTRFVIELSIFNRTLRSELAANEQAEQSTQEYLQNQLAIAGSDNANLQQNLQAAQSQNSVIESQVQQISGTVGTLQKLSNTDPQLLQKYSRVYFLNENYIPASLTNIDPQYLLNKNVPEQFLTDATPFLANMLAAASQAGIDLRVASAYRSFGQQSQLKAAYTVSYGSGANKFSADQGYSEHQLGTAVDFTTPQLDALTLKFASSSAYAWLAANAYQYGFELSYPKNNPYYIFEPWHWRFVGIDLATWLHDGNINFYDAPQRTINQYLISLFNQS